MFKGRFQRIGLFILGGYLWLMVITLGTIVLETFMVYPNIFYNPPESFKAGLDFMKVVTPHDFFPRLGFLTWLAGAASLLMGWHWWRVAFNLIGSAAIFKGFTSYYRD